MSKCGCPHGCNRECDSEARCPYCWNNGKGCPVLFHGATDSGTHYDDMDMGYRQVHNK